MRVLKWVVERAMGAVGAKETPAGLVPRLQDLDLAGLDVPKEKLAPLFEVNMKDWKGEVKDIGGFLKPYRGRLPAEVREQHEKLDRLTR